MKNIKTTLLSLMLSISFVLAEEYNEIQLNELKQKAFYEMLQKIYSESMAAKRAFKATNLREDPISNFATTAPRSEFIVNADISSELAAGTESATVYVSTVNIHDDNFNIIMKANLSQPIPKTEEDEFIIRLKQDF